MGEVRENNQGIGGYFQRREIDLFFKEDEVVKIFAKNSVVGGCVDTFLFCGSTS